MDRIFFENVRCFRERQEVPLAPLTVLVGENSSGKSTFLALVRIAWDLATQFRTPDFNEEPFQLGAHEQVLSFGAGQGTSSFSIGVLRQEAQITGEFTASGGQPLLAVWDWRAAPFGLRIQFHKDRQPAAIRLEGPEGSFEENGKAKPFRAGGSPALLFEDVLSGQFLAPQRRATRAEVIRELYKLSAHFGSRPYAFAPIRTRPQRTYDPVSHAATPEGAHVPMVLASVASREPEAWKRLVASLEELGRQSGLFSDLAVRRLGEGEGDPLQIQVKLGGQAVNLIDVGYGVSQILPIVVDCLRGEKGGTFLLQQPEVHLHPRAQAELGSFLGILAKTQGKRFVIETHSDYLVDRIRMDVRDGKGGLRPEDVSLLYFERSNGSARIHRIELDPSGNLLNPPPGYRSFFLDEERRFLGG